MGKEVELTKDIIIPKQKINRFTFERLSSHLNNIELDDEEEEGDQAGPSGAEPSKLALPKLVLLMPDPHERSI